MRCLCGVLAWDDPSSYEILSLFGNKTLLLCYHLHVGISKRTRGPDFDIFQSYTHTLAGLGGGTPLSSAPAYDSEFGRLLGSCLLEGGSCTSGAEAAETKLGAAAAVGSRGAMPKQKSKVGFPL